ncbi:MAG: hypothetical protein NTW21_13235 [Verrucomicrobia bacterium]|nr:hypothetical protein [Verrucomicrobiota bacterium]
MQTGQENMKNRLIIWILVAAAVLPCRAAENQDPAKAGGARADVAKEVLALTGSRTKIVWARRVAGADNAGGFTSALNPPEWALMGLDTADGKTRAILPGPASFVNPCISPDGEKVFFTDGGSGAIYCVNWDGSIRREFTKGLVQSPWTHPDDGSQWLYFLGDGLVRARMDDASVRETVWRGPVDGARIVSVSADGTHMGGCFPTPVPGVAIMPNGPWRQYGNGCSPCIAPDNSYRFFHMGTEVGHGGVRVYDDGGKNPRAVGFRGGKGGMPGHEETRNCTSWEARWSTDMRFFVVIVESPTNAPACDIYLGQFDEGFTKVVKWVRVTDAPAWDTKPYCWIDPGLGNYEGEVPFTVAVPGKLTPGGEWAWDYGDGAKKKAAQGKHTYTKAGGYPITATQGQKALKGWANVRPQKAPAVTGALAVDETRVLVRFDERVQLRDAKATLGSGGAVRGLTLDPEEKDLLVELDKPVGAAGTMSLAGVFDKAQVPNAVAKAAIRITRASWPSSRNGLIYLFEGNRADNTIYDPVSGPVSAVLNARFDRHGAILCRGGKIELPSDGTSERLLRQFSYYQGNQWQQKTELFTLEMVVQTADLEPQGPVLSLNILSSLWVGQEKRKVVVRLGGPDPKEPVQPFDAGTLPDDKAHHLVIAYRPKRLVCYVDGRKTLDADPSPAQMKWHNALGLNLGGGETFWRGRLEGIAMYSRFVEEAEVARNFAAYSQKLAARKPVASVAVRAKLLAKSAVPSAAEVAPYTRALVVYEYQVEEVTRGTLKEKVVRVARWGLMDSQPTPAAHEAVGASVSLVLESFTDHPELESELLRDTLPENFDLKLWEEAE